MGTPLNQLQQLTGHSPIRFIGTDDLKHFYFAAEPFPLGLDLNVDVEKINYDYSPLKARLTSGSFTPALREKFYLKSFTSGNIRGELTDYPRLKYTITGGPIASPRDVPRLKSTVSGFDYGIAKEVGYIQLNITNGYVIDYWHDHPSIAQTFAGGFMPYPQDEESAEFFLITGQVSSQHVPSEVEVTEQAESWGVMNFYLLTGKYQG